MFPVVWMIAGLLVLAVGAAALGWRLARVQSPLWLIGFFVPLGLVALVIVGRRMPQWAVVPPISWAVHYRVTHWLMAAAVPVLLATLAGRLHRRGQRVAVLGLMSVMVGYFCLVPVLAPVIGQMELAGHATRYDREGVCRQTSEFSCGAAAAVNALRAVGVKSDEATIAREALTGPAVGTDPIALVDALNRLYGDQGVHAAYVPLAGERASLPGHLPVIISVATSALTNHYITVVGLRPNDAGVFVADPELGLRAYPWGFVSQNWHGMGIVVERRRGNMLVSSGSVGPL